MEIKVLGSGCAKCKKLEQVVKQAVKNSNIDASITKIEDIMKIMEYGVAQTPALVINDEIVLSGRIPSDTEIIELLTNKK